MWIFSLIFFCIVEENPECKWTHFKLKRKALVLFMKKSIRITKIIILLSTEQARVPYARDHIHTKYTILFCLIFDIHENRYLFLMLKFNLFIFRNCCKMFQQIFLLFYSKLHRVQDLHLYWPDERGEITKICKSFRNIEFTINAICANTISRYSH